MWNQEGDKLVKKDGIGKIDLADLKVRNLNLRRQLEHAWELLVRRGWWSYLTDFPLLDHDVIMVWVTEKEIRSKISIHYLFDQEQEMWEIILAMVDEVHLSFPFPPGKIEPELLKINGDSHEGTV